MWIRTKGSHTAVAICAAEEPLGELRVRLLAAGTVNKNDPADARSVAVAALRSASRREVAADDHAALLKVWSKRHRDLGRTRTQAACRLHAVLCELIPGGVSKRITAAHAAGLLEVITPSGAVEAARCELAAAFAEDLRRTGAQMRDAKKKLTGQSPHRAPPSPRSSALARSWRPS